jgi:hypothetical protein
VPVVRGMVRRLLVSQVGRQVQVDDLFDDRWVT